MFSHSTDALWGFHAGLDALFCHILSPGHACSTFWALLPQWHTLSNSFLSALQILSINLQQNVQKCTRYLTPGSPADSKRATSAKAAGCTSENIHAERADSDRTAGPKTRNSTRGKQT